MNDGGLLEREFMVPVEQAIAAELLPGEELLWTGRPKQWIRWRMFDLLFVPFFGLLWALGVAIFINRLVGGAGFDEILPGVWLAGCGSFLFWGRFLVPALRQHRTRYALTNERVIITIVGFQRLIVKSVQLKTLTGIDFLPRRRGRGTVRLGRVDPTDAAFAPPTLDFWMDIPGSPVLEGIDDGKSVYEKILATQERLR